MDIKIFTFIKDEEILLKDWIEYHATIVGYNNIYIVDNCSVDNTHNILKYYEKLGITVIYNYPDYCNKGIYLSEIMCREKINCKFLIPIDGDEFIALRDNNNNIITDGILIKNYILSLPQDGNIYIFNTYLNSCAEKEFYDNSIIEINKFNYHLQNNSMMKKFFPSISFISTDHGNHHGVVKLPKNKNDCNFDVFDWEYYIKVNNDLPRAGINNKELASDHWNRHGRSEGRIGSKIMKNNIDNWDWLWYLQNNNLESLKTKENAIWHWRNHGHHEGRIFSQELLLNKTIETDLVLFHFYDIGYKSYIQRIINDINGFGYSLDIDELINKIHKCGGRIDGIHKIQAYINYKKGILKNTKYKNIDRCDCTTTSLSDTIKQIRYT